VLLFKIPWSWLKAKISRLPEMSLADIEKFQEDLPMPPTASSQPPSNFVQLQ